MLQSTFLHIPGIGEETETALWRNGCRCWDDYLTEPEKFSAGTAEDVVEWLGRSKRALVDGDHQFFARRMKSRYAWRAWPEFRDKMACVDIETDGGRGGDAITMIGLFSANGFQAFVKGENLEEFRDAISHYSYIVTFFGTSFDLPIIRQRFRGIDLDHLHLDLCPALRSVGYQGGLKSIERQLGLARSDETSGLGGLDAIRLWNRYRLHRDGRALETLIQYNREDVENLVPLAEVAYAKLREQAEARIAAVA